MERSKGNILSLFTEKKSNDGGKITKIDFLHSLWEERCKKPNPARAQRTCWFATFTEKKSGVDHDKTLFFEKKSMHFSSRGLYLSLVVSGIRSAALQFIGLTFLWEEKYSGGHFSFKKSVAVASSGNTDVVVGFGNRPQKLFQ